MATTHLANIHSARYLMLQKAEIHPLSLIYMQPVKKVMSDSQGLVDFAIRLMIFVLSLPDVQVLSFWGKFNLQKDCNQFC